MHGVVFDSLEKRKRTSFLFFVCLFLFSKAIAAAMTFNGAHICVHPQLLVTCKNWPQR